MSTTPPPAIKAVIAEMRAEALANPRVSGELFGDMMRWAEQLTAALRLPPAQETMTHWCLTCGPTKIALDGTCAACGSSDEDVSPITPSEDKWPCSARAKTDPPQDCDWPLCGCDPQAQKVIDALQEAGMICPPPAQETSGLLKDLAELEKDAEANNWQQWQSSGWTAWAADVARRAIVALRPPADPPRDSNGEPCDCLCHVQVVQTACLCDGCDSGKRLTAADPPREAAPLSMGTITIDKATGKETWTPRGEADPPRDWQCTGCGAWRPVHDRACLCGGSQEAHVQRSADPPREEPSVRKHWSATWNATFGSAIWYDGRIMFRVVAGAEDCRVTADDPVPQWQKCVDAVIETMNMSAPLPPTDAGVSVAGRMERTLADFERACLVHLENEQRRPNPDNALIAVLCDAVRLTREQAPPFMPTTDAAGGEANDRELRQAEHEMRTVALVEWGLAGSRREAVSRWASVIREHLSPPRPDPIPTREAPPSAWRAISSRCYCDRCGLTIRYHRCRPDGCCPRCGTSWSDPPVPSTPEEEG